MPRGGKALCDPKDGVGNAIYLWQERLGDDRDSHSHMVKSLSAQIAIYRCRVVEGRVNLCFRVLRSPNPITRE